MPSLPLFLFASAAYIGAAASAARASRGPHDGLLLAVALGLAAILLHAAGHVSLAWPLGLPRLHFFSALSLVGLGMAAVTLGYSSLRRLPALLVVVLPIAALALLPHAMLAHPHGDDAIGWQIQLHAWLALLAYATLSLAALLAIMLWLQERALRQRRIRSASNVLPPLVLIETLLFRVIAVGFLLLTLALVSGVLFVDDLLAQHLVHKTVLSVLAWLVFGALLIGRLRFGWRGRRAVRLTLLAMGLLLLSFFGSKFVLEVVLQRGA
jgi:ABC-type uncharacterized transport system permease subunit